MTEVEKIKFRFNPNVIRMYSNRDKVIRERMWRIERILGINEWSINTKDNFSIYDCKFYCIENETLDRIQDIFKEIISYKNLDYDCTLYYKGTTYYLQLKDFKLSKGQDKYTIDDREIYANKDVITIKFKIVSRKEKYEF